MEHAIMENVTHLNNNACHYECSMVIRAFVTLYVNVHSDSIEREPSFKPVSTLNCYCIAFEDISQFLLQKYIEHWYKMKTQTQWLTCKKSVTAPNTVDCRFPFTFKPFCSHLEQKQCVNCSSVSYRKQNRKQQNNGFRQLV